jgi:hypothetical protein
MIIGRKPVFRLRGVISPGLPLPPPPASRFPHHVARSQPITAFVDFETVMHTYFDCVLMLSRKSEFQNMR